jgi:hypothetical protein
MGTLSGPRDLRTISPGHSAVRYEHRRSGTKMINGRRGVDKRTCCTLVQYATPKFQPPPPNRSRRIRTLYVEQCGWFGGSFLLLLLPSLLICGFEDFITIHYGLVSPTFLSASDLHFFFVSVLLHPLRTCALMIFRRHITLTPQHNTRSFPP